MTHFNLKLCQRLVRPNALSTRLEAHATRNAKSQDSQEDVSNMNIFGNIHDPHGTSVHVRLRSLSIGRKSHVNTTACVAHLLQLRALSLSTLGRHFVHDLEVGT
eukprot:2703534-Amphidinium_carterae.1